MFTQEATSFFAIVILAAPVGLAVGKLLYLASSLDRLIGLDDRVARLQNVLKQIIEDRNSIPTHRSKGGINL